MIRHRPCQTAATTRTARERNQPRRTSRPAQAECEADDVPAQVRAPNRTEWPDPLNEEELAAFKAGWSFVE